LLIGVVGKPSTGKSTFFRASTLAQAEIANYPFTTIEPNHGIGFVKIDCADQEFDKQCNPRMGYCKNHKRFVPVDMIDVAGLVPGAHAGHGRGNQFLDDLRQADVLIHVIDISGSTNEKGEPVDAGSYDPAKDVKFLELELDQWYLGIIKKGWEKFARTVIQEKQEIHIALGKQLSGLKVTEDMIKGAIDDLSLDKDKPNTWDEDALLSLAIRLRRKTKPMVIACNKMDVPGSLDNLTRLKSEFANETFIGCSAESELALKEATKAGLIDYLAGEKDFKIVDESKLSEKQMSALKFIQENVLPHTTGVQEVLDKAVLDLLGYIAIFPGGLGKLEDSDGNTLPDCFLLPPKSTALDFAFKLHTDFGKKFICAKDVKTKMTVGKDHKLKHTDVVEICSGR
jgi:ribosome-binding ATPase